jgi:threonine dehydrogenase-like Zn-dependent dehydrogenase
MGKKDSSNMKAIVLEKVGKYALVDKPIPTISGPGQLLARIDACSICGSDMHILSDPPGYSAEPGTIIGHEMVGTVVETSPGVETFTPGDRIVCDNNIPCGECLVCKSGHPNLCENLVCLGVDGDGFFAEYSLIPARAALKISRDLPLETAIFAEPLNCVFSAFDKIKPLPGETAAVFGTGPIGLYFIQLLKLAGIGRIIAIEPNKFRRDYASKMGADLAIPPSEIGAIKEFAGPMGIDMVIDAVGSCMENAVELARHTGRILLFGINFSVRQQITQAWITRKELTVYGSYVGPYTWPSVVRLLESGRLNLEPLITHRLSLEDFGIGYEAMKSGDALEVILYPAGKPL